MLRVMYDEHAQHLRAIISCGPNRQLGYWVFPYIAFAPNNAAQHCYATDQLTNT